MRYKDVYKTVADKEGVSASLVEECYKKYWKKVRELIEGFNLPYLGKLYITKELHTFRKRQYDKNKKD